MKPKVTIITAVLNQVESLEPTILSIANQTCSAQLAHIIIDGGSKDGTVDIIKKHKNGLEYWVSESDRGVYDAMNKGWSMADPQSWLLFLGAGDRLLSLPQKYPPVGSQVALYGNVLLGNDKVFSASADFKLKLYNTLHHQALLIPKWLHPPPPFNLEYRYYADFDFNQRLYKKNVKFCFSPELHSYAAPGGLTEALKLDELIQVVRNNFGFFWSGLSTFGFLMSKRLSLMRKFKPIH